MMTEAVREFHQFITPDGITYELHTASRKGRWVMQSAGWGTPPIDYITQRGPFQDGATVKDFFLAPRVIQMLVRQIYCDRDAYWTGRADILNMLRPNRQLTPTAVVPGVLRRILSDNSARDLNVFLTTGPDFDPLRRGWEEFSFQELLRFVAYDPVIFDPVRVDTIFALADLDDIVFPVTLFDPLDNYIGNPSFEVDMAVWTAFTGGHVVLFNGRSAGQSLFGSFSLLVDVTSFGATGQGYIIDAEPGQVSQFIIDISYIRV